MYLGKWACAGCEEEILCHHCSATRPMLSERRHVTGLNLHVKEVFKQALKNIMWFYKYFSHKSDVSSKCSVYRVPLLCVILPHKKIEVPAYLHQKALFSEEPIIWGILL